MRLFKKISRDNRINVIDLEKIVIDIERNQDTKKNISQFSPDFQTAEDQEDADDIIDQN